MFRSAFIAVGLSICATLSSAAPVQWSGNNHFYEVVYGKFTWTEAAADATTYNFNGWQGHLATVTSQGEWDFLKSTVNPKKKSAWLGGSDSITEGVWKWMTGPEAGQTFFELGKAASGFTAWNPNEPNNYRWGEDYLAAWSYGSNWNDLADWSHYNKGYVIEYSAPPSSGPSPIPVPASLPLLLGGGLVLAGLGRLRQRRT